MAERLYMLSLSLDLSQLMRAGFAQRLNMREVDTGYLTHMLLGQLFGKLSPKPFHVDQSRDGGSGRQLRVLAYSASPGSELKELADSFADPVVHSACAWSLFSQKPMPEAFPIGRRLGFELRVSPTQRLASERTYTDKKGKTFSVKKGAEVDVFLKHCWEHPEEGGEREKVYSDWLRFQIESKGGAKIVALHLKAFKRERMLRRNHEEKRKSHRVERPDALMSGTLEVADREAFGILLERGVGRHRAFGFGMLLLKPAT
jgi:CRISPR system Cascade subunit CasE